MLSERLTQAREARGLSRYALSKAAGLATSHVQLIETGYRKQCSAETLAALARVLRVSVEWLLGGAEGGPEADTPTPSTPPDQQVA